jgi:hypothetical protein
VHGGGSLVAGSGLQLLGTFRRNPCSGLARVGDGDGRGRHILSWKHHREVCALLRLRPRLWRKPQIRYRAMEAMLCLFLVGGIVSESPVVSVWGMMVVVGLLYEVQVCSLAKMMT